MEKLLGISNERQIIFSDHICFVTAVKLWERLFKQGISDIIQHLNYIYKSNVCIYYDVLKRPTMHFGASCSFFSDLLVVGVGLLFILRHVVYQVYIKYRTAYTVYLVYQYIPVYDVRYMVHCCVCEAPPTTPPTNNHKNNQQQQNPSRNNNNERKTIFKMTFLIPGMTCLCFLYASNPVHEEFSNLRIQVLLRCQRQLFMSFVLSITRLVVIIIIMLLACLPSATSFRTSLFAAKRAIAKPPLLNSVGNFGDFSNENRYSGTRGDDSFDREEGLTKRRERDANASRGDKNSSPGKGSFNRNTSGRNNFGRNSFSRDSSNSGSRDRRSGSSGGGSGGGGSYFEEQRRSSSRGRSSSSPSYGGERSFQSSQKLPSWKSKEKVEPVYGYYTGDQLYGITPVLLALQTNRRQFAELIVQEGMDISVKKDGPRAEQIYRLAEQRGIPLRVFPKHDLNMMSDNRPHQGFVLRAKPLEFQPITNLDKVSSSSSSSIKQSRFVLALDEVWDPMNFGALLRTAFFLGADKVVVCAKNSAPLSPVVSKASAGAMEMMEVYSTKSMMNFLDQSKVNGWMVLGAGLQSDSVSLVDVPTVVRDQPVILVLGNEGHGLRTNILRRCDHLVSIEPNQSHNQCKQQQQQQQGEKQRATGTATDTSDSGSSDSSDSNDSSSSSSSRVHDEEEGSEVTSAVDSLNVSVAGGILMHHLLSWQRYAATATAAAAATATAAAAALGAK